MLRKNDGREEEVDDSLAMAQLREDVLIALNWILEIESS